MNFSHWTVHVAFRFRVVLFTGLSNPFISQTDFTFRIISVSVFVDCKCYRVQGLARWSIYFCPISLIKCRICIRLWAPNYYRMLYRNIQPDLPSVLKLAAEVNHNQVKIMLVLYVSLCFLWFESSYEDLESWRYSGCRGYQECYSPTCLKQGWHWIQTWELFPVRPWKPPRMGNLSGQPIPMIVEPQREKKIPHVQSDPSLQFVTVGFHYPAVHLYKELGSVSLVNSWVLEGCCLGPPKLFLHKVKQGLFISVGPKLNAVSRCSLVNAKWEGLITSLALLAMLSLMQCRVLFAFIASRVRSWHV